MSEQQGTPVSEVVVDGRSGPVGGTGTDEGVEGRSEPLPSYHVVVIDSELDVNDSLTGFVEHVGPVTDACHAYKACGTCALALQVVQVNIETAIEQLRDLIDRDEFVHGEHHAWFDGEAYIHTTKPICYLTDWTEILVDEIRNLTEEHALVPGRYRIKHMTLNEDECEIELDPQSLPSLREVQS